MPRVKLKWGSHEETKGWQGLNNAAIHSFNSNIINSFVREMFQNSNDARDKTLPADPTTGRKPPLRIVINYRTITREQFPDFDGFTELFGQIKSSPLNSKHEEFFRNAQKSLGNTNIKLFAFEDFNTTGLAGSDDDDESTFSACVLSEGISVGKDKTAGGSFGIGKNAIFGFSKLRTVFYASLNNRNEYIFQGRAKLATYFGKDHRKHSDKIFCGHGNNLSSVRSNEDLPAEQQNLFKRTQPGLSQYAIFPTDDQEWIETFAKAILRNYWLLVDKGELTVELKSEDQLELVINAAELENLFVKYFNPDNYEEEDSVNPAGNPYEFYKCYKKGTCTTTRVDIIGNVRFFYTELDNNKTNAVAYLRNDMVIYSEGAHGFGSINYCGVFICDDDDGNAILRDMEPPTHDAFSPERLRESKKQKPSDGKRILSGIKDVVRKSLQKISDKYKIAAQDIPWLDDLLTSTTGAAGNGSGKRTNTPSEEETTQRIGAQFKSTLSFRTKEKNTLAYDPNGTVPGLGGGPKPPGSGHRKGKESYPGSGPGKGKVMKTRIKSRTFLTNNVRKIAGKDYVEYRMFLSSTDLKGTTDLVVAQKGDAGNVACFEIAEVIDKKGKQISFTPEHNSSGEPTGFRLRKVSIPAELSLLVHEPYKSSFKITHS